MACQEVAITFTRIVNLRSHLHIDCMCIYVQLNVVSMVS